MGSGGSHGGAGGGGGGSQNLAGGGGPVQPPKIVPPLEKPTQVFPEDPVVNPGGVLTGPGSDIAKTGEDLAPIMAYSGGHVPNGERFAGLNAEKLNRSLYDPEGFKRTLSLAGESPASIADYMKRAGSFRDELNASLSKLRNYEGEVYRTISDSGGSIAKMYEAGKPVTLKEFVSTSRSTTPSYKAFHSARAGDTRFVIQSKTGKSIESMSQYMEEREVLFRAGTKFMVTKKTFNKGRGTWDIHMKEI